MHYEFGKMDIYSINEWILYCKNFQVILNIDLFKNYKIKKLFELWRRFLKKTKKTFYTDKLSQRFHRIDNYLLNGILSVRKILKDMSKINIFNVSYI